MLLSLLVATTFDFPGSTTAALAKRAAEATGKPAVVIDQGLDDLRAARFEWETVPSFADQMRQIFGFRPATEEERKAGTLGFGSIWPVSVVVGEAPRRSPAGLSGPVGAVGADGPVDIPKGTPSTPRGGLAPDGEGLSTGDAAAIGPASKFAQGKLHWFLSGVPVAIHAAKAKPEEVRASVLAAVAALPDGEPRWTELRNRFVGGYGLATRYALEEPKGAGRAKAQAYRLKSWFFGAVSEADLKKAFASPGGRLEYVGEPRTPLYNAAWGYVQVAPKSAGAPPSTGPIVGGNVGPGGRRQANPTPTPGGLPPLDPRQPVKLVFTSPNRFELTMVAEQGPTNVPLP